MLLESLFYNTSGIVENNMRTICDRDRIGFRSTILQGRFWTDFLAALATSATCFAVRYYTATFDTLPAFAFAIASASESSLIEKESLFEKLASMDFLLLLDCNSEILQKKVEGKEKKTVYYFEWRGLCTPLQTPFEIST